MSLPEIFLRLKRFFGINIDYAAYTVSLHEFQRLNLNALIQKLESTSERKNSVSSNEKFERLEAGLLEAFKNNQFPDLLNNRHKQLNGLQSESRFQRTWKSTILTANNYCNHKFCIFGQVHQFNSSIDWHYDFLGNKSIPLKYWSKMNYRDSRRVTEIKYLWELNRHQHFITLAKAYFISGDENYAEELFRQWESWMDANPPLKGLNWVSPLELGLRLVSWSWALTFVRQSKALKKDGFLRILSFIYCHAEHILKYHSRFSSANNHLIGEALGLLYAGCFFPFFSKAEEWYNVGRKILEQELPKQVFPSGVNREQSSYYHWYVLEFYLLAVHALKCAGKPVPESWIKSIERIAVCLRELVCKDGTLILLGDDDGGQAVLLSENRSLRFAATLNLAAYVCGRADLRFSTDEADELLYWLFGLTSPTKETSLNNSNTATHLKVFTDAGLSVFTDCREGVERKAVFRFGPLGYGTLAAHGHADALSFNLYLNGQPVLMDPGTFTYYTDSNWRNYFRSTFTHNTITVDQQNQSEIIGPFLWGDRAGAQLERLQSNHDYNLIVASHDGYQRLVNPVKHRRSVVYLKKNLWIIHDDLEGEGDHNFCLTWHVPFRTLSLKQLTNKSVAGEKVFKIEASENSPLDFRLQIHGGMCKTLRSWGSNGFGVKYPTTTIVSEQQCRVPTSFVTIISLFGAEFSTDLIKAFLKENR
jgi:hypothetical protein